VKSCGLLNGRKCLSMNTEWIYKGTRTLYK